MLEIKNLYAGYNDADVIKNISLEARRGEILCIAGPNGCGKSTLLKTIARLLPYRGSITIDGQNAASFTRKDLAKKIALLGQSSQIYFPYTVYDTISLGRYVHTSGFLKNLSVEDKNIITDTIKRLELEDVQNQLVTELSGGQLQRVFLARTLVQDPEIILLDEPTNHLDLKHQIELLQYLSAWVREKNRVIVGVLHDLNLVHRFSDHTILMSDGEPASCGKPEEVLNGVILREVYGMDIGGFMRESLERWKNATKRES
ncbi:iron ABC transporter [Spirochaetia bacterium]|nr:iron ABC transporter [Spirochaetia bacterium]GHV86735.1 iron ABC transporter [Spirochaetia bacterium]